MESARSRELRWRVPLPSRSRSDSRLRSWVRPARSQGHLYTFLGSSLLHGCRIPGFQLPVRPSWPPCRLTSAGCRGVRSRHARVFKPPRLQFESRGSGTPPAHP
ncbi:hypothetical protein NDU88_005098 [Pleurodeles waltl]|uniref:Uncharacterized protein n=1 Tax=Pleurodeles waltl TaxID=8319 RepID=A0AAV7NUC6_PLEWA|nr:hypothetical protein NDU88_005098 [Pleurodeles waltl]